MLEFVNSLKAVEIALKAGKITTEMILTALENCSLDDEDTQNIFKELSDVVKSAQVSPAND